MASTITRATRTTGPTASSPVLSLYMYASYEPDVVGSVISANPTETALVINCGPSADISCGFVDLAVTVGPWAAVTPGPDLPATGRFDTYQSVEDVRLGDSDVYADIVFSLGCDLTSRTVPATCTRYISGFSGVSGNERTVTLTEFPPGDDPFSVLGIIVTAGADKLTAFTTVGGQATTASTSPASVATGNPSSPSPSVAETGVAGPTPTGAGSRNAVGVCKLVCLGLLMSAVL